MPKPLEVSTPSDREVVVTRSFNAPRELVYKAYTTPALVQRWLLGPPGWAMPVCEMDVRVGGNYKWRWKSEEDGKEFGFFGVFQEVVEPAKLVHTEFYDPGDVGGPMDASEPALITVEFTQAGSETRMITRMLFPSKEARDGAVGSGMTDGMEQGYQLLDQLLVQQQ